MMKTEEEKWRSKIRTAIRKNENLTEEQKEILLNRLSFLDRNDWCSFENIYNRCQNAKIEISERLHIIKRRKISYIYPKHYHLKSARNFF